MQPGDLERLARRRCVGAPSLPALLASRPPPPPPPRAAAAAAAAAAAEAAEANADAFNVASAVASAATEPEVVVLADSDSDETGLAAPGVACVSPTPAALDALRSPCALPPAKRSRGAGAGDAGGAGVAGGAPPPQNTLWHFLNQQSAASLPPSAGQ